MKETVIKKLVSTYAISLLCLLACHGVASPDVVCVSLDCPGSTEYCTRYLVGSDNDGCYTPRTFNKCCSCACQGFFYIDGFGNPCDPVVCIAENSCTTISNSYCSGGGTGSPNSQCPGSCIGI